MAISDPERIFYQALCLFPNINFYANAVNDLTVPYLTGAIETEDIYQNHVQQGMTVCVPLSPGLFMSIGWVANA